MKLHEAIDLAEAAHPSSPRTVYVIARHSRMFIFQTYYRNESCLLAFTNKEEADECCKKLYDLIGKLRFLEMSADEYMRFRGIENLHNKHRALTSVQYSNFINTNELIIENILFYDKQFEPIKEFVNFYEDSDSTFRLDDVCYTDINIGFCVEEVKLIT